MMKQGKNVEGKLAEIKHYKLEIEELVVKLHLRRRKRSGEGVFRFVLSHYSTLLQLLGNKFN